VPSAVPSAVPAGALAASGTLGCGGASHSVAQGSVYGGTFFAMPQLPVPAGAGAPLMPDVAAAPPPPSPAAPVPPAADTESASQLMALRMQLLLMGKLPCA